MDKQPTEARQDELAGIREKIARFISEFKDWDGARQYVKDGWLYKADRILSLTVSSGGEMCDHFNETLRTYYIMGCPYCNRTGQKPTVTRTIGEIIKEWEDGKRK
uniref:Uncharacterized protein n=1 Tax=viral metagenome TaxID=1070528 RepID=A0A6M3LJM5_9ZZZZ